MALIICKECGKEYSNLAKACPNCGCPTEYSTGKVVDESDIQKTEEEKAGGDLNDNESMSEVPENDLDTGGSSELEKSDDVISVPSENEIIDETVNQTDLDEDSVPIKRDSLDGSKDSTQLDLPENDLDTTDSLELREADTVISEPSESENIDETGDQADSDKDSIPAKEDGLEGSKDVTDQNTNEDNTITPGSGEIVEKKKKFKKVGIIAGVIALFVLAVAVIGALTKDSLKRDLKNVNEQELHALEYESPATWQSDSKTRVNVSDFKDHDGFTKYNDNKEALATYQVFYMGDNQAESTVDTDVFKYVESKYIQWGDTEEELNIYTVQNSDVEWTACFTNLSVDSASFLIAVLARTEIYDQEFVENLLSKIDVEHYKNPRRPVNLTARYTGNAEEGETITSGDASVKVTVEYDTGDEEYVEDWTIDEDITIEAGKTSEVVISSHGLECTLEVTGKKPVELKAKYNGKTKPGTKVSKDDITVTLKYDDGEKDTITDWEYDKPVKLKAGKTSTIKIKYAGLSYDLKIIGQKPVELKAKYKGKTKAGTKVSKKDIKVTLKYNDGEKKTITDWKYKKRVKLKAGETSTIKIKYAGLSYNLKITCTTLSPAQYKAKCVNRDYRNQLRKASYNKYIKIYGKVLQDCGYGFYRISSNGAYDDVYMVYASNSDIVEDDWCTVYGTTDGIYEYETVLGASQKIPSINAKYVDR